MATSKSYKSLGDELWKKSEKINGELFVLTYGSIVSQLLKDYEGKVDQVNTQLDKMGYNIGIRLIEDFLAKSNIARCGDFKDTVDIIAKIAFKMFLGISPNITQWAPDFKECSLVLEENPLIEFVELEEEMRSLVYCQILCGMIRGALEMVQVQVECQVTQDVLKGNAVTEIRLKYIKKLEDESPIYF